MPKVSLTESSTQKIKLQRGNKIIERSMLDYKQNKNVYDFRGFKVYEEAKKEDKKPKRKSTKKD